MNKSLPTFIVSIALLTLSGCAAPPLAQGIFLDKVEKSVELLTPLNQQLSKELGDTMYEKGLRSTVVESTARLKAPVQAELELGHRLNVADGAQGPLLTRSSGRESAMCFSTVGGGQAVTILTGGGQTIACLVDIENDGLFDVAMFSTREKYFPLPQKAPYQVVARKESAVEKRGSFRQDFLYQGLSRGVLRFTYREFMDGTARPAFTQELTYELDTDGTAVIGFKGMRIKVLRATNQGIVYVVEKHLS